MFPFCQRAKPEHDRIQGLILHYRLDNSTGTVFDASPNRAHGTIAGAPTRGGTGVLNNFFEFDGVDDAVTNQPTNALNSLEGSGVFTCAFFAKATAYHTGSDLTIRNGTGSNSLFQMYSYLNATNGFAFYWNGSQLNTGNVQPVDDSWHHFAMSSVASNDHRIFVDGVYIGTFTTNKKHGNTLSDIDVGKWVTTEWYDGGLDDIRIYDRALSDAEVAIIANYSTGF
jgi:hypothetical protein